jgi:hypothetical protein
MGIISLIGRRLNTIVDRLLYRHIKQGMDLPALIIPHLAGSVFYVSRNPAHPTMGVLWPNHLTSSERGQVVHCLTFPRRWRQLDFPTYRRVQSLIRCLYRKDKQSLDNV